MLNLQQFPEHDAVVAAWGSVFNALLVIANQRTPFHCDNQSHYAWFDLMLTIGNYLNAELQLPGLGVSLPYKSGTVVGMSGKVVRHGVPESDGDRTCLVYYMRDKVQERLQARAADWMRNEMYL
jgi:hypothetical protein